MQNDVITFWFKQIAPKLWWKKDAAFDQLLREQFGSLLIQAAHGELAHWRKDAAGRLAEVIVLDQFSRNIYRDTPQAFAQDATALVLSQEAIHHGALQELNEIERTFLLMPYMHSESQVIHKQAEILFRNHAPESNYEFELKHKVIIDRFGRYPHRNVILGRQSTEQEIEFLKLPGSGF
ncbi:DUF924 domain-containing protein [Gammaproteobacteria bacterium LSUCC0112]|nr:DUF924 domain-containing protein [Gammaproteobacteria bacterium LSUCC0112]